MRQQRAHTQPPVNNAFQGNPQACRYSNNEVIDDDVERDSNWIPNHDPEGVSGECGKEMHGHYNR